MTSMCLMSGSYQLLSGLTLVIHKIVVALWIMKRVTLLKNDKIKTCLIYGSGYCQATKKITSLRGNFIK